jgi:NAD(P)-dependent dehydrogenase (short-subunit alcohol dehydrogenase family)
MKTSIVTGRSRGIGAAIAHRLAPYRLAAIANLAGNAGTADDPVKLSARWVAPRLGARWRANGGIIGTAHGAPCRLPPQILRPESPKS